MFRLSCYQVLVIERIVRITDIGTAEETGAVIRIQGQLAAQAFGQIRIGDEVAAKCNQVGIARLQDGFGRSSKPPAAMMIPL